MQGSKMPVLHFSAKVFHGDVGFLDAGVTSVSVEKQQSDTGKTMEMSDLSENVGNVGRTLGGESLGNSTGNVDRGKDLFEGVDTEGFEI